MTLLTTASTAPIHLSNVLHVPSFDTNLILVRQIIKNNAMVLFGKRPEITVGSKRIALIEENGMFFSKSKAIDHAIICIGRKDWYGMASKSRPSWQKCH